ncbi:MAG: response regulator [Candidatus Electrothrix sp. AW1]|nr:response regulator [Candidatus Electrothrix gigas]
MKIFSEKNIGKLIILNSALVAVLMWVGVVAHTYWDSDINLNMELIHMEEEYIRNKKVSVRESVLDFIHSIDVRHDTAEQVLQRTLRNQVEQIHSIAMNLYRQNAATMNKDTLEKLVVEAIRPIRFNNGRNYFFIRSMSGITKLWPPDPTQEEKSIYNNSNEDRLRLFNSMFATVRHNGSGFHTYNWPKPGEDKDKLFKKVAYIKYFKPFDWYIGADDYLIEVERDAQQHVANIINQHASRTDNEYMSILDLRSIQGGKTFATMLVNPNQPHSMNNFLNSTDDGTQGERFREKFLNGLQKDGEVFVKYKDQYKDEETGEYKVRTKMSYFKLYPKWSWIIARGFYFDELTTQIERIKEQHKKNFQEKVKISFAMLGFILLGSLCISLPFSHKVRTLFLSYRQRLEKSNRELTKAMDRAHAATIAKSEFLANMSHEIRTPMNGIINLSELTMETELTDKQADYMKKILFSSKNLLEIINDILDFSKIEAGMLTIEKISFNLPSLFDKLMLMFTEQSQQKNLLLTLDLPPDLPEHVIGDPMRLYQVLSNLIGNAIKFTQYGEITVQAKVMQRKAERAVIQFTVRDTGIGIAEEKIALLFQSFTQADSSTARQYGGTGLGLTICKRLVALMGGKLSVKSKVKQGSSFFFSLNLALNGLEQKHDHSSNTSEQAAAIATIRYARILLVEDNIINQQVAQEILAKADLQVETVANGKEAVEAVQAKHFDAVLMDIQMPIMDGYEATKIIRQNLKKTDLPILAMTAHAVSEERDKCFEIGMNDHIAKPIHRHNLFLALSHWIGKNKQLAVPKQSTKKINNAPDTSHAPDSLQNGLQNELQKELQNELQDPLQQLLAEANSGKAPQGLHFIEALQRVEGNKKLYLKLLKNFCREHKESSKKISALLEKNDRQGLRHFAHSLKGVAANIGMVDVQKLAGYAEQRAESGPTEKINIAFQRLIDELTKIISYLSPRLERDKLRSEQTRTAEAKTKEGEENKDHERNNALLLIERLKILLEQSDFSSLQFVEGNQEKVRALLDESSLQKLTNAIEEFHFKHALSMIHAILEKQPKG